MEVSDDSTDDADDNSNNHMLMMAQHRELSRSYLSSLCDAMLVGATSVHPMVNVVFYTAAHDVDHPMTATSGSTTSFALVHMLLCQSASLYSTRTMLAMRNLQSAFIWRKRRK